MVIAPNVKKMVFYTSTSGLFTWSLLSLFLTDNHKLILLAVLPVTIIINIMRLTLFKKEMNIVNNQLFVNGTLVSVSHRYKWLTVVRLDSIKYESTVWQKAITGSLDHYMFSKEQWALLKRIDTEKMVTT